MMRQDPTDLRGRTRPFLLPLLLLLVAGLLAPWPAAAEAAAGAGSSAAPAHDTARAEPEAAAGPATAPASADPQEQLPYARPAVEVARQAAMIVTANPHATRAGEAVLARGGSAADAAIAAALVLAVVEPQSSGLGGGGFALTFDAASGTVAALDGRETAPEGATPQLFLDEATGGPMGFREAVVGGRSVGVPGLPHLLEALHRRDGQMPWADLVAPAIALARDGFAVSPRLHALLAGDPVLATDPAAGPLFYPGGRPAPVGHRLVNPALADTLTALAWGGAAIFSSGPLADAIVAAVQRAPNPGMLSATDLAAYRVKVRAPVCAPYRGYRVCGMGPPSSGGITVLQALGILAQADMARLAPDDGHWHPAAAHRLVEALRLAFADRNLYIADTDFVPVPVAGLLDPAYLAARAALVGFDALPEPVPAGTPPLPAIDGMQKEGGLWPFDPGIDLAMPSTSHLSVVDVLGNAVSMTNSIETAFGAHRMVGGFLLNNQLTDFSFRPAMGLRPVANRVEPGKRPRSSMAPTLVFDETGALAAILGSPGGSSIIGYVTAALVALLDWRLGPADAVNLPHVFSAGGGAVLESGPRQAALAHVLAAKGHDLRFRPATSGLAIVQRRGDGWVGAADPRREGTVGGL